MIYFIHPLPGGGAAGAERRLCVGGEEGGEGPKGVRARGAGGPALPGERQFHSWLAPQAVRLKMLQICGAN